MTSDAATAAGPEITVVVPCYRSVATLRPLVERLLSSLARVGRRGEIILIDDASPEPLTWQTLVSLQREYPASVRCFRLARNVGQHNAIVCGFAQASPSVSMVVTMDDDLQHRPEDVPALLRAIDDGADLAIGAYESKQHQGWRNAGGRLVDRCLRTLFKLPPDFQLTSFRAIRRFAVEDAVENRSRYSYLTASLLAATRFRVNVPVAHEPRAEGTSGYSLATSIELAINLFLGYSRWPLYLVVAMFGLSLLATTAIMGWALLRWLVADHPPEGWASTVLVLGITSTFNLAGLGVIALLSTRTHRQLVGASGGWRIAEEA